MPATAPTASQASYRDLIRRAMRAPLLTREHEVLLAERWVGQRCEAALDELVTSHIRLVVSQATKLRGYGLPQEDMVQEGILGLLQAASRFDPARGVRFSTYAMWWIRAAMQDFILRNWSIVRLGTTSAQKSLFFNLRRLRARIARQGDGMPRDHERAKIAAALQVEPALVEAMEMRLAAGDQSTNLPINDERSSEVQDLLVDERPTPEEAVTQTFDNTVRLAWLEAALRRLPAREEMIIRRRHLSEQAVILEDLGRELGVSKERVRQLEQRALERLRHLVTQESQVSGGVHPVDEAAARDPLPA